VYYFLLLTESSCEPDMKEVEIRDWQDFVAQLGQMEGWAFRGESDTKWPLIPAISRRLALYCPDSRRWPDREMRALRIFRRKAHNYFEDTNRLSDDLRCLALMQHHGAPTRLFDFTKSPYVAAFFALESAYDDSIVYGLNTPKLWVSVPQFDQTLTRDTINPCKHDTFQKYFLNNTYPVVWIGEPLEMDRRLIAQSGLFVVPGMIDKPLDELLESYDCKEEMLIKFILKKPLRKIAMKNLYKMNITYGTLFPDLEGLARASAYELEHIWEASFEGS
jgi:hypothetical protein